jgi:tetratricopeptide (TPR) repeat protein
VGWADTLGGVGRPQELINEDIRQCDYAVFVLHDRWGSPTGTASSGTEEEWALVQELYKESKIRNVILFFKNIERSRLCDPGHQLKLILEFKNKIESEKRHLFIQYSNLDEFTEYLEMHVASCNREHDKLRSDFSTGDPIRPKSQGKKSNVGVPNFLFWISESLRLSSDQDADFAASLFCATKAIEIASSDEEWARAKNSFGVAQFRLGNIDEAIKTFSSIAEKFYWSLDVDRRAWHANALVNKGVTLGALGRRHDAIAVYDDLIARFGRQTEAYPVDSGDPRCSG